MAVFDSFESNKVLLDDTHVLKCTIEAAENEKSHTVYILKVQRGPFFESSWQTSRRYSDFDALNNVLINSGIELPLPPKKVFGKLEREFVAERQQGLQNYINFILSYPLLSSNLYVKRFFDPERYSFNFSESSLQHVSMVFRSEGQWEIDEPLNEFGWRIRKQYFLVRSKSDPKCHSVLSWMSFGPDKYLAEKDLASAVKIIESIKHPYIFSPCLTHASDKGVLAIYDFLESGMLRDILCKVKPKGTFLKKYGRPKAYAVLGFDKIKLYGRQILLALKFLHERGLHHGHLHTGNIAILDGTCKLTELLNSIMGIPSQFRPHFIQLRKVQSMENADVYSFGRVIYEMTFGQPLEQSCCDTFPNSCYPELRSVLEATVTTEACKKGLPSASDLLLHPFFSSASGKTEEKVHLKVPSHLKESLKGAREQIEKRIKEEQKAIRRTQRLSKVHAQLSSEEEKKKRISERKKQQRIQNLEATQNGEANSPTPTENSGDFGSSFNSLNSPAVSTPPPPPPMPPSLLPPPPPPLPPLMTGALPAVSAPSSDRSALLSSIQGFNKNKLKKSETQDHSTPKI